MGKGARQVVWFLSFQKLTMARVVVGFKEGRANLTDMKSVVYSLFAYASDSYVPWQFLSPRR